MRKTITFFALVALVAAAPVLAGEGHKCTASTQDCLNHMAKSMKTKGLIGVDGEWDESISGYRIRSYIEGSNAEAAGIKVGDVLVAINGIALDDKEASYADAANRVPGSIAAATVVRDGEKLEMSVEMIAMGDELIAKYIGAHMLEHAEVEIAQAD